MARLFPGEFGPGRNVIHRRRIQTLFDEDSLGRIQNAFAAVGAFPDSTFCCSHGVCDWKSVSDPGYTTGFEATPPGLNQPYRMFFY